MNRSATPNSEFVLRRPRVDDIVIHGDTYMRRYHLINNRRFGVRIHHIRLADYGRELHDHPFDFLSIVLKGSYKEILRGQQFVRVHRFGIPCLRRAEDAHIITRVSRGGTWTLVFRGPIRRRWGFWRNGEWIHHSEYNPEA